MSIIEQAARRLEELRRGGIELPTRPVSTGRPSAVPEASLPARVAARLKEEAQPPAQRVALADVSGRTGGESRSKTVEIDLARLASMGYITPDGPRSEIADDFRVIKRPLLMNAQGQSATPVANANLIMTTSALPGEGKTFCAINLAISMAMEMDRTVLLVDADVARPSVLSRLGLPASPGFLDVLADPTLELGDVLLRTNIDKLTLLPSGIPRPQATELLASDNMARLLAEMATRYADRIIVFDAPPLLPSTESRVLAARMGQVILVVEVLRTRQSAVIQAMATLESCPVVMPLLNKASRSEVGAYYGYYGPSEKK